MLQLAWTVHPRMSVAIIHEQGLNLQTSSTEDLHFLRSGSIPML